MVDGPCATAAPQKVRPQGLTTSQLIDRLREVDPDGTRVVFMEIGYDDRLETDAVRQVEPEDAAAVWDHNRVVLSNEREADHGE